MPQKGIQGQQIEETTLDLTGVDGTGLTNVDAVSVAGLVVGTGANNIVQLDASSRLPAVDGSLVSNVNDSTKLPLIGGTMTGLLTLSVTGEGGQVDFKETSTSGKASVDIRGPQGEFRIFQNLGGGATKIWVFENTGILNAPDNILMAGAQSSNVASLTRKDYVDSRDILKVSKTGDTMTGQLEVQQTGANALIIARAMSATFGPRFQLEDRSGVRRSLYSYDEDAVTATFVLYDTDGGTQFANLTLNSDGNVSLTGATTVPTLSAHLTRKDYVDANDRLTINAQLGSYTLALSDENSLVTMSNGAANFLTVPPNSSVAFPIGTQILVSQEGTGITTISPGAGVTLNSAGGLLALASQYSTLALIKKAADVWLVAGDLA